MKKIILKAAAVVMIVSTAMMTSLQVRAQDGTPVYNRETNPSIGISVDHATGATFIIRDQKGAVVMKGTVKSNKTFFISTKSLREGIYHFEVGGNVLQSFEIK